MNLEEIFSKKLTAYSMVELQEIADAIYDAYHSTKKKAERETLAKKYKALAAYYNNEAKTKVLNLELK